MDDIVKKIMDEAAADFDAWREEHDPLCLLPVEEAAVVYADFRSRNPRN